MAHELPRRTAASRARELRQRRGLSTGSLAEQLTRAGVAWDGRTVEEFEDGRREHLDIDELFALALVLSVPPIVLLTDPTDPTMAVTQQVEVPTAYGLLWLLGEQPLHGVTNAWRHETVIVRLVRRLHEQMWRCIHAHTMLRTIEQWAEDGSLDGDAAESRRQVQERELVDALVELRLTLQGMRDADMAVPRLVDQETLVSLGRLRGIELEVRSADLVARANVTLPR